MRKRPIQKMTKEQLEVELELLEIRQKNRKKHSPKHTRTTILIRYLKYHLRKRNNETNLRTKANSRKN